MIDHKIIGTFVSKRTGTKFEYAKNPDPVLFPRAGGGVNEDFPHLVADGPNWYPALVLKTVVHIVRPVPMGHEISKIHITKHEKYRNCD